MKTLLLNCDYTFNNYVDWKKAYSLVRRGCVEVLKESAHKIKMYGSYFIVPAVIKLTKFIREIYRARVSFSKKAVLIRDKYICQYCSAHLGKKNKPTIDHVIPKSRGGKTEFENCVASCYTCNKKKNNRTPSEANMFLLAQPKTPTIMEYIRRQISVCGIEALINDILNN